MFTHLIFSWKFACRVWLVIIFLLLFMQQIFLECQLMPDSGPRPYTQGCSDLALSRCPWRAPHTSSNGFPCICQWDRWISAPEFLSSEPYPFIAMPYENPMKAVSLSPRTKVCMRTVSVGILSVNSDRKLNSDQLGSLLTHITENSKEEIYLQVWLDTGAQTLSLEPRLFSLPIFQLHLLHLQTGSALVVSRQMWNQYFEQSWPKWGTNMETFRVFSNYFF